MIISKDGVSSEILQHFCYPGVGQFIDGQLKLMTAEVDLYRIESFFESNRYRIEIESNRKISETS
jgi:hypothetical protein